MRGDVYRLKRPRSAQGHEQQGERYAVVVQANAYDHLSTWVVAPTTTKSFGSMIHPTIELLGQDVRVLVEQTTAVDPQRLGGNRAKCAVARSILVIIWHLLANPEARFTDLGPDWHERKTSRDRKIRAHLRQLQALGLEVTITPAA